MKDPFKEIDIKEMQFADTVLVRDIDSGLFQSIVIKTLATIEGIAFISGNLIDDLLGREGTDRIKGISVEQDEDKHSVSIKVEVNIAYGLIIPEKAEEIQNAVVKEVTKLTGLHVSCVHVVFKGLIPEVVPVEMAEPEVIESFETADV